MRVSKLTKLIDAIAFRTTRRYNVVRIHSLKPNYYDIDTRLLHSMMDLLVDYVEIELASLELNELAHSHKHTLTFKQRLHRTLPWCLRSPELIRSRELGLNYLIFEKQFHASSPELLEITNTVEQLYLWWKDVRPVRETPEDASGFNAFCDELELRDLSLFSDTDPSVPQNVRDEIRHRSSKLMVKSMAIEKKYYNEDSKMLKKLIDIRNYLWT